MSDEPVEKFELPPFIPIFVGLDDHLRKGKMSLADLGAYLLLNRWCDWKTGIYYGCAATLATLMGGRTETKEVQRSLYNLRRFHFINYRHGSGSRGSYNILIHKYLPRLGGLRGYRLNAFAENSINQPLYERRGGEGTVDGLSHDGGRTVKWLCADGGEAEGGPLQECKECKTVRILELNNPRGPRVGRLVAGVSGGAQPTAATPNLAAPAETGNQSSVAFPVEEFEPSAEPQAETKTIPAELPNDRFPAQVAILPVPPGSERSERPTPQEPAAPLPPAGRLASRFFKLQGKPAKYRNSRDEWTGRFEKLIRSYGEETLAAVLEYAFTVDGFWSEKLLRSDDPLRYFEEKLKDGNIIEKFERWQTCQQNRKAKERSNGHNHPSAPRGAKQVVDNTAAIEEAKRWVHEQSGTGCEQS